MSQPALVLLAALLAVTAAAAASHPFTASSTPPVLTSAVNYKGFHTYNVESRLSQQFTSIQHCLPIQLVLLQTPDDTVTSYAVVDVNSTSLEGSYTIHPYVEKEQLRISLNGTVKSRDLVNVTITIPAAWGNELVNSTITGRGYVNYGLGSSAPKKFQLQLSGTGTANMILSPNNLVVNADTNASFIGGGLFDQVLLNWNSKNAASLSNANNVIVNKAGTGGVYVAAVTYSTDIIQTGRGVVAVASTDTASLIQLGGGAAFIGVGTAANITYAGGKNATYIQGTGISGSNALTADVQYTTAGNSSGSLVFSATQGGVYPSVTVNGDELKACLNITGWSTKKCNESAVPIIPDGPDFPQKLPKCNGVWILSDSDVCYKSPLLGYECQLVTPANGGEKFALVLVLLLSAGLLIYVNGL